MNNRMREMQQIIRNNLLLFNKIKKIGKEVI